MKGYTSNFLKGMAFAMMGFPLVYPLSVAILFDIPFSGVAGLFGSPFFYLVSFWVVASGYGLWEMKRWGWYAFLFAMSLVAYLNFKVVLDYSETHHPVMATLIGLGVIFASIYLVAREVRVPYFLPRIPWWQSEADFRVELPARVGHRHGDLQSVEIMDLSWSGCFLKSSTETLDKLSPLEPDDEVVVKFTIFGHALDCVGRVVWITEGGVTHPRGMGVKFTDLKKSDQHLLKIACRRLRKISLVEGGSEGYQKRLKEVHQGQEDVNEEG